MDLYQQAYGFTVLRVLVDAFELWLGLLVVLVLVAGVRLSGWWLPRAALVSGALLLLLGGLANPEAWVADRNIARYEATGKLDVRYLESLGADAVPTILAGLPPEVLGLLHPPAPGATYSRVTSSGTSAAFAPPMRSAAAAAAGTRSPAPARRPSSPDARGCRHDGGVHADIADLFELDPAPDPPQPRRLRGGAPLGARGAGPGPGAPSSGRPCGPSVTSCRPALAAAREAAAALRRGARRLGRARAQRERGRRASCSQALGIGPGDDVVVSNHGYPTAAMPSRRGARSCAPAPSGSTRTPADVVAAFAAAVTERTRLVVVDQITSPTALVLPVAEVAAAVAPVPVLVDAAHVPGALPGLDVEALGVAFWVGNLHKWAYTPRAAATLWVAPQHREAMRPLVTSWSHGLPFPERFDLQGTVDHSAWLAVPDGIAAWHALGGWAQVARNARLLLRGGRPRARRARHAPARAAAYRRRPCLRLVALPPGVADTTEDAEALWQRLYAAGFVVPPVAFDGRGSCGSPPRPTTTSTTTPGSRPRCPGSSPPEPDAADVRGMWKDRPTAGTAHEEALRHDRRPVHPLPPGPSQALR